MNYRPYLGRSIPCGDRKKKIPLEKYVLDQPRETNPRTKGKTDQWYAVSARSQNILGQNVLILKSKKRRQPSPTRIRRRFS